MIKKIFLLLLTIIFISTSLSYAQTKMWTITEKYITDSLSGEEIWLVLKDSENNKRCFKTKDYKKYIFFSIGEKVIYGESTLWKINRK